jgi:hypothetical protein
MLVGSCFIQSSFTRTAVRASAPLSTGVLRVDGTHRHSSYVLRGIVITIRTFSVHRYGLPCLLSLQ